MNGESLLWVLALPAALGLGLFFLFVYATMVGHVRDQTKAERLSEYHHNAAHKRDMERQDLLALIQDTPKHLQAPVWAKYDELRVIGKQLDDEENYATANAASAIDDQTQYELDHGINPYAKAEKPQTSEERAIARKQAWRGF